MEKVKKASSDQEAIGTRMYKASVLATAGLLIVASLFVYAYTRGPDDDGKFKFGQKPFENFEISNVAYIVLEANRK